MELRPCVLTIALLGAGSAFAQEVVLSEAEYNAAKLNGTLPPGARPFTAAPDPDALPPLSGGQRGGGPGNDCDCWIEPDGSYTLAMEPNDDGSSAQITLPFQFNLYGDTYNTVFINNNGNISFVQSFGTFSSTGFPNNTNRMVAPFWADVDTRANGGQVWYKVTPTAMYVNWVGVGYFNQQTDKRNWFQLIITDGSDPVIGQDKNVSFCYKDMQWTTGSASGGTNGFGGTAATVGANRANNTGDYIQFGRFDQAGSAYDGPFGANDGVSWLDFKNFVFTTITFTQNIPPIAAGLYLCDTLRACIGQTSQLEVTFLSPENGQTTTVTSSAPTLSNWSEASNVSGISASVTGEFTPGPSDEGFHTVIFQGTDNGTPNLTTTVSIIIEVIPPPAAPPVIVGNTAICTGGSVTLTATGPYSNFVWSNGQSGPSITVTQPGDYTVTGGVGLCQLTSDPFTVGLVTPPSLAITGPSTYCGTPLPELVASPGYDAYTWSNGSTNSTIQVGAGTYTVTGTYQGCQNVSSAFTLTLVDPGPPAITGPSQYCEGGTVTLTTNAASYQSIVWSTGQTTPSITVTAGTYTVTATSLNCTYTSQPITVQEVVLPPVTVSGDAFYCQDGLATISATPGFETYVWNNNAVGQTINVTAGTYFVSASIGPCTTFSTTFAVAVQPNPVPVITGLTFSCGGTPVTLSTAEAYPTYQWSTSATSPEISATTGTYTVTVTNAEGCSGTSAPFNVLVANDPTAAFVFDPASPAPIGSTINFDASGSTGNGGDIDSYTWSFGDADGTGEGMTSSWTYEDAGLYTIVLVVENEFGCLDTTSAFLTIFPPDINIPNVFTPNSDGSNDTFNISNIEFWNNEVRIYNRWGQVMKEFRNYRNTWSGSDVSDGTYFYEVVLSDGRAYTGHLTVLR